MSTSTHALTHAQNDTPTHRYTAALANHIESDWQSRWRHMETFRAPNPGETGFDASKPKKYVLDMFPYPSGIGLHVGHPVGYIATDAYARYLRMTGHNVLHAMGYDAFGLPAEQYAVQTGQHPRITTEANVATMRAQLTRLGMGHDPRRGVSTTDEAFYRWTQWIFLQMYNSWYDAEAEVRGGSEGGSGGGEGVRGRARPITELVKEFDEGKRATSTKENGGAGRAWKFLNDEQKRAEIDGHRLAFVTEVPVNWCPRLGTVLANEEVTADGRSERGNFPVFKRPLKQWMMRITAYAQRLERDLDKLTWPEPVKNMQRHWIGTSEGAMVRFGVDGLIGETIEVFTTRPDTLFGATYIVLAPEHPMVDRMLVAEPIRGAMSTGPFTRAKYPGMKECVLAEHIVAYRAWAAAKTQEERTGGGRDGSRDGGRDGEDAAKEKTGVFTGAYALNPVNGARVPVFIADYVMMGYGTGAIMAVPGHDVRDFAFAKAMKLPIVRVVKAEVKEKDARGEEGEVKNVAMEEAFVDEGVAVNSPWIEGLATGEAKAKMIALLEERQFGVGRVQYRLRDWLFSRQRYWGEPFPIVYDERGVAHALPEKMLPVLLPALTNFQPETSDDANAPVRTPLSRAAEWVKVRLDLGDGEKEYTRETNTMPNWAGSCWYYLRYLDPENSGAMCGAEVERYWMGGGEVGGGGGEGKGGAKASAFGGVDLYVGGVEHAVLHLLYARFWHKVLFDLGHVSTPEPFQTLFNQGYVQAFAYTDERGVYVEASKVTIESGALAMENQDSSGPFMYEGKKVSREYGKMGKSLKNAVAPDEICAQYGCDTMRLYEMTMGPLEASKPWNPRDIVGSFRFVQRVWRNLLDETTGRSRVSESETPVALVRLMHKTILANRQDMERLSFNTAVSRLIEFNNALSEYAKEGAAGGSGGVGGGVPVEAAKALILMLAPFAPHACEELWHRVVHKGAGERRSIVHEAFPVGDAALAADDTIEVPVQVQGKVRSRITVAANADAAVMEAAALADAKVIEFIAGKPIKKVIVVAGKLVNVVV